MYASLPFAPRPTPESHIVTSTSRSSIISTNASQAAAQRNIAPDIPALVSFIRTSKRPRKPSNTLCDAVRLEKMVKRRADKKTTALTGNYTNDYDSNSGLEEPKKRNKKERFEKSIDVLYLLLSL